MKSKKIVLVKVLAVVTTMVTVLSGAVGVGAAGVAETGKEKIDMGGEYWHFKSAVDVNNTINYDYSAAVAPAVILNTDRDMTFREKEFTVSVDVNPPGTQKDMRFGIMVKYVDPTHWAYLNYDGCWMFEYRCDYKNAFPGIPEFRHLYLADYEDTNVKITYKADDVMEITLTQDSGEQVRALIDDEGYQSVLSDLSEYANLTGQPVRFGFKGGSYNSTITDVMLRNIFLDKEDMMLDNWGWVVEREGQIFERESVVELSNLIKELEEMDLKGCTTASVLALDSALKRAKILITSPNVSQDELAKVLTDLKLAKIAVQDDLGQLALEKISEAQEAVETAKAVAEEAKKESLAAAYEAKIAQEAAETAKANADVIKQEAEAAMQRAEQAQKEALEAQKSAEEAKLMAETAGGNALAAQEAAEAAKAAAEISAANASEAELAASEAESRAREAQGKSEAAGEKAEEAKTQALAAQRAAEEAKSVVETAKETAEKFKDNAQEAAEAAKTALENAIKARDDAIAAKDRAVLAKDDAAKEKDGAVLAKDEANRAKEEAKSYAEEAEKAKKAVELARQETEAARKAAEDLLKSVQAELAAKLAAADAKLALADVKLTEADSKLKFAEDIQGKMEQLLAKTQYIKTDTSIKSVKSQKKKQVKITWEEVNGAEGYIIQYATKANFSGAKSTSVKGGTKTSGVIKKLKSRKKYYFRVKAYRTIGKEMVYTNYSIRKSVKVK